MRIHHYIVATLLRLYPAAWRSEYGPELADLLLARPLGTRIICDVIWNGLRQRARATEPSTFFGLATMLAILVGLVGNIASLPSYGYDWTALLQQSSLTLPRVVVQPMWSEFYVLLLVVCGCWTYLRHGGQLSQSGKAAMRVSLIAGIPVMLAGVLMLLGVLNIMTVVPGDAAPPYHQDGFTYTYFSVQHHPPTALDVLAAPLFRLPASWIWGLVGGVLGRKISPFLRKPIIGR